jgi:hypothetical protein
MVRTRFAPLLLLLVSSPAWAANPTIPTELDLQQMFDKKDYRACLQQSARVLNLTGEAAKAYDRFNLQMRRGECLLNLNDPQTALSAYNAALAAADTPLRAETARAHVALIKGSRNVNFVPAGGGTAISIIPLDSRKAAMAALCKERLAAAEQEYKAAVSSTSLTPIMNFFPKIQDMHALEITSGGSDEKTQPILLAMGERARELINQELRNLASTIDTVQSRANQMVVSGNSTVTVNGEPWWLADTRIGLSPEDRDGLRGSLNYINQIITVSEQARQAAQSFGRDGKIWDQVIADGQEVLRRAQNVLNAE